MASNNITTYIVGGMQRLNNCAKPMQYQ